MATAARQTEVPGTERKISKKLRELGEAHADAINAHTKAAVKRRDSKLALIAQMKDEGVKIYRDTEVTPAIDIVLSSEDKLTVKKVKSKASDDEEGDE